MEWHPSALTKSATITDIYILMLRQAPMSDGRCWEHALESLPTRWWSIISRYNKTKGLAIQNHNEGEEKHIILEEHSATVSPIPSPEEFAKYKQVMEDMPERIFRQFEEDSISVRELSCKALEDDAAICTGIGTAALIFRSTFSPRN